MAPISKLFMPPPALAGCILAGVFRDTRGANLPDADRTNNFPATPLVTVTLVQQGTIHLIPPGKEWRAARSMPALPGKFVMRPQGTPVSSWAQGDVVALTLGVYPDAWLSLGGDHTGSELPRIFEEAMDQFARAPEPTAGWRGLCEKLEVTWSRNRQPTWHRATSLTDWAKAVATRAALSGSGRGVRSIERRFKRYTGHTRSTLEFFAAFEQLHEKSLEKAGSPLAEIAIDAGYSDQSHMGRVIRRATGFSPARLNKAIETEEAFWCYRLLGERF